MSIWTAERIETLSALWLQGVDAIDIASKLGLNVSKNAIIGKAKRLKLGSHPSYTKMVNNRHKPKRQVVVNLRRAAFRINGARAETPPELPAERPKPPVYLGLGILEIGNNQCRFSHSENKPYLFCGAASDGNWCPYHHRIVYRGNSYGDSSHRNGSGRVGG